MAELERFRDHCREMATTDHSPACVVAHEKARSRWNYFCLFREWRDEWGEKPSGPPKNACVGECISDKDRALFGRLAAEVDDYLSTDEPEGLFA